MKRVEKICNDIIRMQEKRKDNEYKREILKACKKSQKGGYKVSPYELMFLKSWKVEV